MIQVFNTNCSILLINNCLAEVVILSLKTRTITLQLLQSILINSEDKCYTTAECDDVSYHIISIYLMYILSCRY